MSLPSWRRGVRTPARVRVTIGKSPQQDGDASGGKRQCCGPGGRRRGRRWRRERRLCASPGVGPGERRERVLEAGGKGVPHSLPSGLQQDSRVAWWSRDRRCGGCLPTGAGGREWEESSLEEVGERDLPPRPLPLGDREAPLGGRVQALPRSSLRNRHLESGPPGGAARLPPTWGRVAGAAWPPSCAPAAWLAAYFPSWQASRCRQGNACGELFILLKFAVGLEDVGGEWQAAAGTVLFRSWSTCVV